jgi:hypothetical protein
MSPAAPVTSSPPSEARWVELTVARIAAEFDRDSAGVRAMVRGCHRDLVGAPAGALPELVERLARQRIMDALTGTSRS